MVRLSISLLGTYQVLLCGKEIVGFDSDKARALLAYLAIESDRPHRRQTLAGLLWPERTERAARHSLSQALFNLRTLLDDAVDGDPLGGPALAADRQTIQFNRASDHWLDVAAFTAALDACERHPHRRLDLCAPCIERLHQAVDLYRGSFLDGFSVGDSPAFEEWMVLLQERFHRQAEDALRRLARCHELRGEGERALGCARRYAHLAPWREDAHRQVMRLLAAAGQRNAALAQYETCRQVVQEELGVELEEKTVALYRSIRDGGEVPADTSLPPHNLPAPYTLFVGREVELAEIGDRLRDRDCRLLTLVGPGGSGKTRLAIEAATDALHADQGHGFTHGVYVVYLAPLQSLEAIVPAVAQALGFAFRAGGDPGQQLLDYLRSKRMLLLLDNAEHLLGGSTPEAQAMHPARAARRDVAGLVTDILRAAASVKVLVTSRTRLDVRGEHLLPIPGMDVPASPQTDHPKAVPGEFTRYSAVQLFLAGARRVRPDYQPTEDDLAHTGRICRLLRGMPLGILLAAGWIKMLTPAGIAAEIDRSLDFLEADTRDAPQRQRSMRATFDYSWHLLTEREREVFRGISIFSGGFTHAAAWEVIGATLRELRGLVEKSVLECGPSGRYEVHELLRQYGRERLDKVPAEERAVQDRHCAYYAEYLQAREARLVGSEQSKALAEIEAEIDNVRAVWDWAVTQGRIEDMDCCLESLAEFYDIRAWYQEGEAAFARAAQRLAEECADASSQQGDARPCALALGKALARQGQFCDRLGLTEQASALLRKSLAILRELDARREVAYALSYLGRVFTEQGSPQHREALAIFEKIGDRRGMAICLRALGWNLVPQGEYGAARQLVQQSLTLFRELGDQRGMALSLMQLGYTSWVLGEYEAAKRLHQESYALSQGIGDREGMATALGVLARDACGLGEYERGKQLYGESLALFQNVGSLQGMAWVLGDLSELATVLGEYAEATQLARESLALDEKLGYPVQIAWASRVLGNAARELGDLELARRYLRQALEIGMSVRATAPALLTVVGIAALLAGEGKKEWAAELLALVLGHPYTWQWTKDRAAPLVAELEAELSPDRLRAAQERGRARDLDATAGELLAELGTAPVPQAGIEPRTSEPHDLVRTTVRPTIAQRFEMSDQDPIGHGGMGDVFRGFDTQTGRAVAIKVLKPEVLADQPDVVARFLREGEALRRLNHPNIVDMVAAVEQEGRHYLIT
jgi:predicted ATPase/DNA-binding SARP family transcriptional activator